MLFSFAHSHSLPLQSTCFNSGQLHDPGFGSGGGAGRVALGGGVIIEGAAVALFAANGFAVFAADALALFAEAAAIKLFAFLAAAENILYAAAADALLAAADELFAAADEAADIAPQGSGKGA